MKDNIYLYATNEMKANKILPGASFPGKKGAFELADSLLFKKGWITTNAEKAIRRMEASKGKRPGPGECRDPRG